MMKHANNTHLTLDIGDLISYQPSWVYIKKNNYGGISSHENDLKKKYFGIVIKVIDSRWVQCQTGVDIYMFDNDYRNINGGKILATIYPRISAFHGMSEAQALTLISKGKV